MLKQVFIPIETYTNCLTNTKLVSKYALCGANNDISFCQTNKHYFGIVAKQV